mmetsp:Transcript_8972/g.31828  ORF Transcript_8972/g.31828 Transcript_8972/m.31828 type:complete len:402 (+) Transcript_8972:244-1449(+)
METRMWIQRRMYETSASIGRGRIGIYRRWKQTNASTRDFSTVRASQPIVPRVPMTGTELVVSRLCLGTMMMGTGNDEAESHALLNQAYECGINFFDTAEMYPVPQSADTQGNSERILGSWIKQMNRDNMVVASKATGPSGQMEWIRGGPRKLGYQDLLEAVEGSLTRLKTDHIDLYQIHWPDRYVPMFGEEHYDSTNHHVYVPFEEQFRALEKAVKDGKIRYIGLSNETPWGLMQFQNIARTSGLPIVSLQNAYSLLCRTFDTSLAECCHMENVSLLAYSPLAMGLLTGKYTTSGGAPPTARLNKYKGRYAEAECRYSLSNPNMHQAVASYRQVAEDAGLTTVELSIRFVLDNPLTVAAVTGASDIGQLLDLVRASALPRLSKEIVEKLEEVHRMHPNPCP